MEFYFVFVDNPDSQKKPPDQVVIKFSQLTVYLSNAVIHAFQPLLVIQRHPLLLHQFQLLDFQIPDFFSDALVPVSYTHLLQKTYTEDFMTGKRARNTGQRNQYYVENSHPAIVSAEVFDRVQEEMAKRARLIHDEDGTLKSSGSKYNGKNFFGNLLVCGNCGASYRRRTERGKILWRCATRIEHGKDECTCSPTLNEEWLKGQLAKTVCGGDYDEGVVRRMVQRIEVYAGYIVMKNVDSSNITVYL